MATSTHQLPSSILDQLRAGDEQAFSAIFLKYHQRVFYFAARFVEEAEAKDIAAEAFATLWQRRAVIRSEDGIASLLFVAARNRCFNSIRRNMRHQQKHAELFHRLELTETPDLELEQIHADLTGLLLEQVNKLPQRMRDVFLLSYERGLKPAEIAQQLGLSVQTVRNQKLSAIKVLKAALGSNNLLLAIALFLSSEKFLLSR